MPKLTGYEVCRRLREDASTKNIPIIMITALHEMDDRIKGIEAGANDFTSKPFNKIELLARVKVITEYETSNSKKGRNKLSSINLSELAEGVIITDEKWKIRNINQTAQELLNIQRNRHRQRYSCISIKYEIIYTYRYNH